MTDFSQIQQEAENLKINTPYSKIPLFLQQNKNFISNSKSRIFSIDTTNILSEHGTGMNTINRYNVDNMN